MNFNNAENEQRMIHVKSLLMSLTGWVSMEFNDNQSETNDVADNIHGNINAIKSHLTEISNEIETYLEGKDFI